ncbi:MAG: MarR family transcriptional regulator [Limnohabitans sp.]|nr:MarR family transcriptional regulator [Limnohabitans sp.]
MDTEAPANSQHPEALRLWLRLLTCSQLIEKKVRSQLRSQFETTLPRFDLMAQLEREPQGIKMNELSKRMMVTGGNITAITDQLVAEHLVERVEDVKDRRSWHIQLTPRGRRAFKSMAMQHEVWIVDSFGGLSAQEIKSLHQLLGKVKNLNMESF